MNSFQKGARSEREFCAQLNAAGFPARRGRQFGSGSADNPDVVCAALGNFHIEVKNTQQTNPFAFFAQAARDAARDTARDAARDTGAAKIPVVAMRRNGHPFLIVIHSADFLRVLAACDLAALSGSGGNSNENEKARAGKPDAGSSGELASYIPTAADLQGQRNPHLQITKLFLRLTKAEFRDVLADIKQRHPDVWESVAGMEREVAQ